MHLARDDALAIAAAVLLGCTIGWLYAVVHG